MQSPACGKKDSWQHYRLGTAWLGSSCAGRIVTHSKAECEPAVDPSSKGATAVWVLSSKAGPVDGRKQFSAWAVTGSHLDTAAGFVPLSAGGMLINWHEFTVGPPQWLGWSTFPVCAKILYVSKCFGEPRWMYNFQTWCLEDMTSMKALELLPVTMILYSHFSQ